jgi:hypothetical protein
MSLSINGMSIKPKKSSTLIKDLLVAKNNDLYEMSTWDEYFRTLKDSEIRMVSSKKDKTIIYGPNVTCKYYGFVRNILSLVFIKKTAKEVWEECSDLPKDNPYPHALYHLINFSDQEGYIGPSAVRELSVFFTEENISVVQNSNDLTDGDKDFVISIITCIRLTARDKNGYLQFS